MKRFGIVLIGLASLTGCVSITGQMEVDWKGNGEIGATVLMPSQFEQWIPSLEQSFKEQGYHTEQVSSGDKSGFHFYQTLDELKELSSADASQETSAEDPLTQDDWGKWLAGWFAEHFTITTDDRFFYQDVTVDGELDFRKWPLLSLPFFDSVAPKLEFTLPVMPEHNADEVVNDRTLRWHLSWEEQNPIYVHVRIWKITHIIWVGLSVLLLLGLTILFWRKTRHRTR